MLKKHKSLMRVHRKLWSTQKRAHSILATVKDSFSQAGKSSKGEVCCYNQKMNTAFYSSRNSNASAAAVAWRREELVSLEENWHGHHHQHHGNLFANKSLDNDKPPFKNSFNMSSILPNKNTQSPFNFTRASDDGIKHDNTINNINDKSTAVMNADSPFARDPDWWGVGPVNHRDSVSCWLDRMIFLPTYTAADRKHQHHYQTRSTAKTRTRRKETGISEDKNKMTMLLSRSKTRRLLASILNGRNSRVHDASAANEKKTTPSTTCGANGVGIKLTTTKSSNHDRQPKASSSSRQLSLKEGLDEEYAWPVATTTTPLDHCVPSQLWKVSYSRFSSSSSLPSHSPRPLDTSTNAVPAQQEQQQQQQQEQTTNTIAQEMPQLAPWTTTTKILTSINKTFDHEKDKGTNNSIPLVIFVVKQQQQQQQLQQQTPSWCKNASTKTMTTTTSATTNPATTISIPKSQYNNNASSINIDDFYNLNSSFKSRHNYFHDDVNDDEFQTKQQHLGMNHETCRRRPTSMAATTTSAASLKAAVTANKKGVVMKHHEDRQLLVMGRQRQDDYRGDNNNKHNNKSSTKDNDKSNSNGQDDDDDTSVSPESDYGSSFSDNDGDGDEYSSFAPSDYSLASTRNMPSSSTLLG